MKKIFWHFFFLGAAGFALGLLLARLRLVPSALCHQKGSSDAFWLAYQAAYQIAEAKGVKVFEIGFGVNMRTLSLGRKTYAMVLPRWESKVTAPDVPETIMKTGRWGPQETQDAVEIFSRYCGKMGAPQLVLDVGSHVGYYSLLAAAFGCRAFAFDGNKEVLAYLNMSIALNDFSSRVRVFEGIVSNATDVQFDGWTARRMNDPKAKNIPSHVANKAVMLDDVVRQPVLYVKVDIEGWEPAAFSSGKRIFTKESPLYIFFEMTYHLWNTWKYEYLEVMQMLKAAGYMCKSSILQGIITLPETKSQFGDLLKAYSSHCDPKKIHFCQDEFFCVHPSAKFNPITKV